MNKQKRCKSYTRIIAFAVLIMSVLGGIYGVFFRDNESIEKRQNDVISENVNSTKNIGTKVPKEHNYSIFIKKSEFMVYLLDNDEKVNAFKCALGKNPGQKEKRGDMKTPTGIFKVDEIIDSSSWTHDFGDGKGEIAGAYGPWFISLDTLELSKGNWDGIGIHGTHDLSSLGTMASEGCIRISNSDLEKLKQHVKVGTIIRIEE